MELLTPWHLLLVLVGFVVLFGHRKLPEASRSLGRSLRIFKSEIRGMSAPDDSTGPAPAAPAPTLPVAPPSVAELTPDELDAEARRAEAAAAELRARGHALRPEGPA